MIKIIFGLFILGLSFGCGPCIASCGPVLILYIAGTKKNILKGLQAYLVFSLARISVYLLLGLCVFSLGRFILDRLQGSFSRYVFIGGGGFIVLMGILITLGKRLEFKPLGFFQKKIIGQDKKSMVMLGLIIGLLPCAPLLIILSYIGLIAKSNPQSLIYAFSFGVGTIISPLILLVMAAGWLPHLVKDKRAVYAKIFTSACGLIIIFFGLQLIIRAF